MSSGNRILKRGQPHQTILKEIDMKKTKVEIENTLRLADELLTAALKVVSNQVNRDLHQHINNLADCAMVYSKNRYS
jgi:hypothetical protein